MVVLKTGLLVKRIAGVLTQVSETLGDIFPFTACGFTLAKLQLEIAIKVSNTEYVDGGKL
jgi:hypothetical protein